MVIAVVVCNQFVLLLSSASHRCLEEAILNFAGSVLVISHDRWFLDRVATHILAFEGDSKVRGTAV